MMNNKASCLSFIIPHSAFIIAFRVVAAYTSINLN